MKNLLRAILLLALCCTFSTLNAKQAETKSAANGSTFLIDPSKPYVYIEVDHVGPRKPLRDSEPNTGLWLRLKNNCRVPIVVMVLGAPPNAGGELLSVADEVVPDPGPSGDVLGEIFAAQKGLAKMTDMFRWPDTTEEDVRGAEEAERIGRSEASKERPHGYNSGYEPAISTATQISPGGQILFSLPANHLSKYWHIEIPFRFALKHSGTIRPPYSYVAFFWDDLPVEYRAAIAAPGTGAPSAP